MRIINEVLLRALTGFQNLQTRMQDEDGQTMAEYGLLMVVIAVAVVVLAIFVFRSAIVDAFTSAAACLNGDCATTVR